MRIAHFIDSEFRGGAESLIAELCEAAYQKGHELVLFHTGHQDLPSMLEGLEVDIRLIPARSFYASVYTLPIFLFAMALELRRLRIDVLHSHLFSPVTAGSIAAYLARIPHVGTFHDTYILEERPVRAKLVRLAAKTSGRLVVVSKAMREVFCELCGLPEDRFDVLLNGVRMPPPISDQERRNIREQVGSSPEETLVCSVGRLVSLKRFSWFIDLAAACSTELPLKFIIVGEGPEEENLKAQVTGLGLGDRVSFLGYRENVTPILQSSDMFVLCSETEGLSRSVLEAMAAGLPCVLTDVGGNSELVEDGLNGFLVAKDDFGLIVKRVEGLLNNKDLRLEMGKKSLALVEERFLLETMIAKYFCFYQNT